MAAREMGGFAAPTAPKITPVTGPIGISGQQLLGQASGTRYQEASQVVRGTILASYLSTQFYEVATDFGRFRASYLGLSRGRLGAMESGGFMPGAQVWIAIQPNLGGVNAVIVGGASYPVPGFTEDLVRNHTVWPQVAGLNLDPEATNTADETFSDRAYTAYRKVRNFNSGIPDMLDGEWAMQNPLGAGVGVELFRTWVRAGPMAGLYMWPDTQRVRLLGGYFEHLTVGREYQDRPLGPGVVQHDRRMYYPADTFFDNTPQVITLSGPQYGGYQQYGSYREKDNLEGPPGAVSRVALTHEYRGLDGTIVITAGSSLTLRKSLTTLVPIENRNPIRANTDFTPKGNPNVQAQPMDEASAHVSAVKEQRVVRGSVRLGTADSTIASAMGARGLVKQLVNWQAAGGFDRLPIQWGERVAPERVFGGPNGSDEALPFERLPMGAGCWQSVPCTIQLNLDPYGATKQYVVGTAIISLTEDGGVTLEDAFGSRVLLTGGNVSIQAAHNITLEAGQNILLKAGKDITGMAARSTEFTATEGRLTMAAGEQAALIGGVNGSGGVLIHSLAPARASLPPPNQSGSGAVGGDGISITSKTNLSIKTEDDVRWESKTLLGDFKEGIWATVSSKGSTYYLGRDLMLNCGNTGWMRIGQYSILKNINVAKCSYGQLTVHSTKDSMRIDNPSDSFNTRMAVSEMVDYVKNNALDKPVAPGLKGEFLTSQQYLVPSGQFFSIPQAPWAQWLKGEIDQSSILLRATFDLLSINGTNQFPGSSQVGSAVLDSLVRNNLPGQYGEGNGSATIDLSVSPSGFNRTIKGA